MLLLTWCSQRVGGLAMVATLALSTWVIAAEFRRPHTKAGLHAAPPNSSPVQQPSGAGIWTVIFAHYCLLVHLLISVFPLRSCWSIFDITSRLPKNMPSSRLAELSLYPRRCGSSGSLSSNETLAPSKDDILSAWSSTAGDDSDVSADADTIADTIIHAVIIPNYKENVDTLRETLEVLALHPQATDTYHIYLAMEQRERNVETKALQLVAKFKKQFHFIDFTLHPANMKGELAGKGSNVGWAARKLSERYALGQRRDVVVTVIDADSHLSANYFAHLTSMHISHPATATTTLYSAPVIFDRNAQNVPAVVRVADIMWAAAQISGMYSQSSIAPPMSVYSLSLELVDRVRGWDCGAEAIGEDMHMFLKCFFALNGHLTARTILSPVSQCNVTGGGRSKGLSRAIKDVRARYRQALRHMWGALDLGYLLRKTAEIWHGRKQTLRAWRPLHSSLNYIPGANALECTAIMVDPSHVPESGIFSDCVTDTLGSPHYERIFYLFYRMFEAHFLPLQMTILVCASSLYSMVADPNLDSHNIAWIFPVCTVLRILGFLEMVAYLVFYERFHNICVKAREREMSDAGLSEGMHFSHRSRRANWIDYLLVPLVAPLYVAIPSAVALTCHFWTLDLVYTVSKKATRKRGNSCSLLKGDCMV